MITGKISAAERYFDGGKLEEALRYLMALNTEKFSAGRKIINGDNLFSIQSIYDTIPATEKQLEAHRKYADVQYIVEGSEAIYYKNTDKLTEITVPYNEEKDCLMAKLDNDASKIILTEGDFAVFFPEDAHCPECDVFGKSAIKKVVMKILL